jgi:hypothetical protein
VSRINIDAVAEKVDCERRKRVMQAARRRAARSKRHPGVNSRNRNALTYAHSIVPEGWRSL